MHGRRYFELPLTDPNFDLIREQYCVCQNNEVVDDYHKSNDELMIMVKRDEHSPLPTEMQGLNEQPLQYFIDDPNWYKPPMGEET